MAKITCTQLYDNLWKGLDTEFFRLQYYTLATYFNLGLFRLVKYSVEEKFNSQHSCNARKAYGSQTISTYEGVKDSGKVYICTEILYINMF